MLSYDGFRIIKSKDGVITAYNVTEGRVDYEPVIKYRIEKKCAFDPTITIRRGAYHEDKILCVAILSPAGYSNFRDFMLDADSLWIEFDDSESTQQYPITEISQLPKLSDDGRRCTTDYDIEYISLYTNYTPIDFSSLLGWGSNWGGNYGF